MAVFLSPGVFTTETSLPALTTAAGQTLPAFVGTARKGPMNKPTLCTNPSQAVDVFGPPSPDSYLMYAVLAFFEDGNACYITRIGVECEPGQPDGLSDICIDTSGANVQGWGRIPVFSGIDYGRINLRAPTAANPFNFHPASVSDQEYNDADLSGTHGATAATINVTGTYTGATTDAFTVLITDDPTVSSNEKIGGATFQAIRSSDGTILAEGTLAESGGGGTSQQIDLGNGLKFTLTVSSGILATNDTFTFTATPDNRKFSFAVEGVYGAEYTMPTAVYTTTAAFVTALNGLISHESYEAISFTQVDGTVIPQVMTTASGRWIQLATTPAWALHVGQVQYAFDIPRSYLIGTHLGPYTIQSQNNQISFNVIGPTTSTPVKFSMATGINLTCTQLAANINPAGAVPGGRLFDAYALTVPGGNHQLVIIVSLAHEFDQLQLQASWTNLKSLRFAETTGILFPYKRAYRGYTDNRVSLPASSETDATTPLSCALDDNSADCLADSAYYANIVGFLVATSAGTWINDYTLSLAVYTEGVGEVAGRYKIMVTDKNGEVVDIVQDINFDKTTARYIGNVINPGTPLGGTAGNTFVNWEERDAALDNDPTLTSYVVRQPSVFNLNQFIGGADGIPSDPALSSELDAAVIGNPALSTGVFALQNPESYDIDLLVTPGFMSGAVIGQCLQMCEARGNVLYLVDPPFGLRPQQVVDWHNGMLLSDLTAAIDSSYGALYWSWVRCFDQFNNIEIWVPPSGRVAGIYARTSQVGNQWDAPAGLSRGRMLTALDVEYSPSQGERDLLYGSGNAVNPLVNFPQSGIVIWGQRTLSRQDTVVDRVNVRMLLNSLKKELTQIMRTFIFEPNDAVTRAQVVNQITPLLADIQGRRGLNGFGVVCDTTNNTPARITGHQLWVSVFIQPPSTTEFVALNLVNLSATASFSASEVLAAGGIIA